MYKIWKDLWRLVQADPPSQQITINNQSSNDGLNQPCYSSQWNLCPIRSTKLFLQQRQRKQQHSLTKTFFGFLLGSIQTSFPLILVWNFSCFLQDAVCYILEADIPNINAYRGKLYFVQHHTHRQLYLAHLASYGLDPRLPSQQP